VRCRWKPDLQSYMGEGGTSLTSSSTPEILS
ncbi:hypothetical protein Pmani_025218, partial [Petrolisthes manimaculis]